MHYCELNTQFIFDLLNMGGDVTLRAAPYWRYHESANRHSANQASANRASNYCSSFHVASFHSGSSGAAGRHWILALDKTLDFKTSKAGDKIALHLTRDLVVKGGLYSRAAPH
jgi:hypothetical protein